MTERPRHRSEPDLDRLRDAMRQLVEGVAALHARGLVHRDLKPSNVLVDRAGRVRVLDFGLVVERAGATDGIAGTPAYMSPEQAAGRPADAESDWYAVGVMLYEALAGRLPYEGSALQVIVGKLRTDPAPVRELAPAADPRMAQLCDALLSRDPKARPSGARILSLLGTPAERVRRSIAPSKPELLVGRDDELAALNDALEHARRGERAVVCVHGPSGAGKSLLVERFLSAIGERACVLAARCFERETVPYAALDGIVDALAQRRPADLEIAPLSAVFPVLDDDPAPLGDTAPAMSLDPRELRRSAARALAALAERVADGAPLVMVVDDAHWGDGDSVAFFSELARLPRSLLVLTYRGETSSALLQGLREAGVLDDARRIEVGPLSPSALRALVGALAGPDADVAGRADRIAVESGGNAMLAYELAARARLSSEPASLERVIEERLETLSGPARALLEVVCVAGAPTDRAIAERAATIEGHAVAAERALTTLRLARMVGERGARRLAPYHDRIREVTTSLLDPPSRRARHAAIAEAYARSSAATPELLSLHLHGAGLHERALPHTLAAARRAASALAFDRAASLFARVVEHTPEAHPEHAARLVELADALRDAGRGVEAAGAYLRAAPRSSPDHALELRRRAVEQLLRCGYVDRGLGAMRDLLADLELPARERRPLALASVLASRARLALRGRRFVERPESAIDPKTLLRIDTCWAIGSGLVLVDPLRGLDFFERAVLLALDAGEPMRVARSLAQDATFAIRKGPRGLPRALAQLEVARGIAARIGDPMLHATVTQCEALASYLSGRFPEALAACERVYAEAGDALRLGWERETVQRTQLKSLYFTGELGRLTAIVEPALELAVERRDLYAEVSLRARAWYVAPLCRNEPEHVHAALDASFAKWASDRLYLQSLFELGARVDVDLYLGEGERAHDRIVEAWPRLERMHLLRSHGMRAEALFIRARAAIAAGRLGDAKRSAARLIDPDAPWADGLGTLFEALIERNEERALASLLRAEAVLSGAGMALFAASAEWRRGELVGGEQGRALVDRARAQFSERGVRAPERMLEVFAPRR